MTPKPETGRSEWMTAIWSLASIRPTEPKLQGRLSAVVLVLRLGGVGLLAWIGWVHWMLWHLGYKDLSVNGPLFLVNTIAAAVFAVMLLAWPRPLVGLLSTGFVATTIAALVISLSVGLFGFQESISANFVVESLVLESLAVVVLGAWTVIAAGIVPRRR